MACVIAAPSSGSGKTLLTLVITAWARKQGLSIQTFKVGPDYLDPQQLSAVSNRPCRNLDLVLCNQKWVKDSFFSLSQACDFAIVEGVMGLYDGVGSSEIGSTSEIAQLLNLPVILVVDARGQAASLAALIKGFRDQNKGIKLAGVVLNQIRTSRHKDLLAEVLSNIHVNMLGCLPINPHLRLASKYLGLAPAHEIENLESRMNSWASIAKENLDLNKLTKLLEATKSINTYESNYFPEIKGADKSKIYPVAIVQDRAFHFRYPETKDYLEALNIPLIEWNLLEDKPLPKGVKGIIIPGGFPEQYAQELSNCPRSLGELKKYYGRLPIYAECGGMLVLGKSMTDLQGNTYPMADLLPFHSEKGSLKVGYRNLYGKSDSLIIRKEDEITGHEFHYWELKSIYTKGSDPDCKDSFRELAHPWEFEGWKVRRKAEGWSNSSLHASWVHIHWPSRPEILSRWLDAIKKSRGIEGI